MSLGDAATIRALKGEVAEEETEEEEDESEEESDEGAEEQSAQAEPVRAGAGKKKGLVPKTT
jgi:hypothetical protein